MTNAEPASTGAWAPAREITGPTESGRRPSVAVFGGSVWVAFERDAVTANAEQEVVARVLDGQSVASTTVVHATRRVGRLDPILHVERGRLWLDWKEDLDLHFSRYEGGTWTLPVSAPWTSPTWLGVEESRRGVRTRVLGGGPPTTP